MDATIRFYKRKFKNALEPMLVMLLNHKETMGDDSWITYVQEPSKRMLRITRLNFWEETYRLLSTVERSCGLISTIFKQLARERSTGIRSPSMLRLVLQKPVHLPFAFVVQTSTTHAPLLVYFTNKPASLDKHYTEHEPVLLLHSSMR